MTPLIVETDRFLSSLDDATLEDIKVAIRHFKSVQDDLSESTGHRIMVKIVLKSLRGVKNLF